MKTNLIRPIAHLVSHQITRNSKNALRDQERIRKKLTQKARNTVFGKEHGFKDIKGYGDFKNQIPIKDYEALKPYFLKIKDGLDNVCWPGTPLYLTKTSGTTSGAKYIPITSDSMPNHIDSARNALFNYISRKKKSRIFNYKMIFLSGSPVLDKSGKIKTGRLSGIVNHRIPAWVKGNQVPSYATNSIEDWETKVNAIVKETIDKDLSLISGIPPWVVMYFEKILDVTGKNSILEVFPNLSTFVYGGVNFQPYKNTITKLIGGKVDLIETYPASEGFIAYSIEDDHDGLLLNTNSGIFFEFVEVNHQNSKPAKRICLEDVELNKDYAVIINSNAGLWGYDLGDMVRFVSINPYKVVVSGRTKHFISAFGEHVIVKEIEEAMVHACAKLNIRIKDFTIAPEVNPKYGLPYHEWFVEFDSTSYNIEEFENALDMRLREQNTYYNDLITGKILRKAKVTEISKGGFALMMKSKGKLGGQNKVPRVSNNREIAELLQAFIS